MYFLPTPKWIVLCMHPNLETTELEHQTTNTVLLTLHTQYSSFGLSYQDQVIHSCAPSSLSTHTPRFIFRDTKGIYSGFITK